MNKEEYIILYKKYLSGTATLHEIELLDHYKDEFDIESFNDSNPLADQELIKGRITRQIEARLATSARQRPFRRLWWSVAASLLILSTIVSYFGNSHKNQVVDKPAQFAKSHNSIVPGSNKAILILGNSDTVNLDQTTNGRITQNDQTLIKKLNDGVLKYERIAASDSEGKIVYNTIITPRGGQYNVILSDGTSVWLNSASSLRYPISFIGIERHVELNGEAYFEVAKNKKIPFTVNAREVNVKVLGTHFNIAAYDDDPSSKTTLLEGSVRLSGNGQEFTLTPGQQAISEKDGRKIITKTVNVQDAIAWKNGYFSFRREPLQSTMRKIARWYDVEVVYQGKVSNKLLSGSVLRTQKINELLSYLEIIGIAKFKIEGRRIMVKAN